MFKICGMCKVDWNTRQQFLCDKGVYYYGYQVFPDDLDMGLLLFEHQCGTTMSEFVKTFLDLDDGPVYDKNLMGTSVCPGYCLEIKETRLCENKCSCAHVRRIIHDLAQKMNGDRG